MQEKSSVKKSADPDQNFLTWVRHTYAGPWPRALLAIIGCIAFGHLIAVVLFGAELFSPSGLLGSFLGAVCLVAVGILVKRKYPSA